MSIAPVSTTLLFSGSQIVEDIHGCCRNEEHFLLLVEEKLLDGATDPNAIEYGKDSPLVVFAIESLANQTTGVIDRGDILP